MTNQPEAQSNEQIANRFMGTCACAPLKAIGSDRPCAFCQLKAALDAAFARGQEKNASCVCSEHGPCGLHAPMFDALRSENASLKADLKGAHEVQNGLVKDLQYYKVTAEDNESLQAEVTRLQGEVKALRPPTNPYCQCGCVATDYDNASLRTQLEEARGALEQIVKTWPEDTGCGQTDPPCPTKIALYALGRGK